MFFSGLIKMNKNIFIKLFFILCVVFSSGYGVFAQSGGQTVKSQEFSEGDQVPVLIKHLPDWENARKSAVLAHSIDDLRQTLGERPVYDLIDFAGGTEAVTVNYLQGKLLIVEYANPQQSIETDTKTQERLADNNQNIFFRRTGNYNIFVFDAPDEASANLLIEQIKYGKTVQWLGQDPTLFHRAERAFIHTASDLFMSILIWILIIIAVAVATGLLVGGLYYNYHHKKRLSTRAFSDAGGMVRLNLDELTAEPTGGRFLNE